MARHSRHAAGLRGVRLLVPQALAILVAVTLLLVVFAAFAGKANGGAEAGASAASPDVQTGRYHGGGFPSTPVNFGVSANRQRIKNFRTRVKLDCYRGGIFVGNLVFKRIVIQKIHIQRTQAGGRFVYVDRAHLSGGGRAVLRINGVLIAPNRARGKIRLRARGRGVSCRQVFGPTSWTARH